MGMIGGTEGSFWPFPMISDAISKICLIANLAESEQRCLILLISDVSLPITILLCFSDAFSDPVATFKQFQRLTQTRNEWAHVQPISMSRVMGMDRAYEETFLLPFDAEKHWRLTK